jgi:alcohol dehydrogenase class IV
MPISSFHLPTRLVHGRDALAELPRLAGEAGIARALLVSDPHIAKLPFYGTAVTGLERAGIHVARFEECGIDARLAHVDSLAARVNAERLDGVVSIGGGSVMCTGKAVAITAPNSASFSNHAGYAAFARSALPQLMVPTTAGSGSEVSQYTIVKDEQAHRKLVGGGPGSFPAVAILDPVVLESLPARASAVASVDALTHAIEAYFTDLATPLTDAIALEAVRLLVANLDGSIHRREAAAREQHLLASTMANIACGNARLGLAHSLSIPLEGKLDLAHGIGVGVLLPRVLAFNAEANAARARAVADALGAKPAAGVPLARPLADRLFELYDEIGFPRYFDAAQFPAERIPEMAEAATSGLWGGGPSSAIDDRTVIESPNLRKATVGEARRLYEACFA